MTTEKKSNRAYIVWTGIALSIIVIGLCLFLICYRDPKFEGVYTITSTIFSGLAFVGLLIAIFLQREDLKLQQAELTDTRTVFKDQGITFELQRFENTFFNLLTTQSDIVRDMELRKNTATTDQTAPAQPVYQVVASGRDCFKTFYRNLKERVTKLNQDKWHESNPNDGTVHNDAKGNRILTIELEDTVDLFKEVYKQYQSDLSHYFRNLYTIVRFVHDSELKIDKPKYMRLIRAQLSAYELTMLFYNCLANYGSGKFKQYIEDYHLLKNLDWELLIKNTDRRGYRASAFGAPTKQHIIPPNNMNNQ